MDDLLALSDAAKLFPHSPGGRPPHISTLVRWIRHGVHGVRLRAVRCGARWYVPRDAVGEFIRAQNPGLEDEHRTERADADLVGAGY